MSEPALIALLAGLAALTGAAVFAARVVRTQHGRLVRHELAAGHLRLRRRMANLAGRERDRIQSVQRAETMYGWVWITEVRRRRMPLVETVRWSPFRWTARRAQRRHDEQS